MKECAHILLSGGHNISNDEVINYMLDGLDSDYDPVIASITTRHESKYDKLTLQETQDLLQKHEIRLERSQHSLNSGVFLEFYGGIVNSFSTVTWHDKTTPFVYLTTTESQSQQSVQPPISHFENLGLRGNCPYPQSSNNSPIQSNTHYNQSQPNRNPTGVQYQYSPSPTRVRGRGYGRD